MPARNDLAEIYKTCSFDDGSVALYTSLSPQEMPLQRLWEIALGPQYEWESYGYTQLLCQPALPKPYLPSTATVEQMIETHLLMDVGRERDALGGADSLKWQPHVFVVVGSSEGADASSHTFLVVHVDCETSEAVAFYFASTDLLNVLSGVTVGTHGIETLQDFYEIRPPAVFPEAATAA